MSDAHKGQTGGWEPIPQSEGYDGDATAFVQLPPEFMLEGTPLEAPGHGYVPPMIVPLTPLSPPAADHAATDPAATGAWPVQGPMTAGPVQGAGSVHEVPAHQVPAHESFAQDVSVQEQTGQWTIPTVEGDAEALEDSGEYTTSRLAQYASSAPATLPGGAPAPWAVPEASPEPDPVAETPAELLAVQGQEPEPALAVVPEPESAPEPSPALSHEPSPESAHESSHEPPPESAHEPPPGSSPEPEIFASAPADFGPADLAPADLAPVDMSIDSDEHPHTSYTLRVNGADRPVTDSWIGESLLYVLRERLGLAGAKDGCSQGECGACNVQVDGRLVASCLVPAATAAGCEVRTVEGLAVNGEPSDVQRALAKCGVQCGFCIPGMAMTVHDLLEGNHAPTELETRQALCGNLCRCSGYRGVLDAVNEVVAGRAAEAGDEARIPHQIPHPHDGGTA
ncbi:2Fe-2S iron-sulfur cluster-binding protein [Streptomyces sp. NPDC051921]|uniref:2Fe-2S iron-sulfur cluster-binding protein n=1 Tax=Streptomyces sp. NPDC051921 TaxID=3155806 RepID=UPI0034236515